MKNKELYKRYSTDNFNRLIGEVQRLSNVSVAPPLQLINTVGGAVLLLPNQWFFAGIGATSGTAYTFTELQPDGNGNFNVKENGLQGTGSNNPAYEINAATVTSGTVVKMFKGLTSEYLFEHPQGTGGTASGTTYSGGCGIRITGTTISFKN